MAITEISLPQLIGHDRLTHSRMQTMKTCARKHYIAYELGIRRGVEAQPLRMGSAIHTGIDLWQRGVPEHEAVIKAVAAYDEIPAWADTDEKVHDWNVERETVARLLCGYFWRWSNAGESPLDVVEVVESEGAFDLPIRNPETGHVTSSFRVAGKRDAIVRLRDGRLAVKETKSVGESIAPDSDYWLRLDIDQQISLYMLAARENHDVQTVLYDLIRKPGIAPKLVAELDADGCKIVVDEHGERVMLPNGKPRQTGDAEKKWTRLERRETPEEFGDRLTADITERPDFYFARREIPRLKADLDEFAIELWQQQQSIRETQKHGRWFRNTAACRMHGRCTYLDICRNGINPDGPLPTGFVRVTDIHPELSQPEGTDE